MQKCPNCGQMTARTSDWACQWCGYPLISGSYGKIPRTYKQLQKERAQQSSRRWRAAATSRREPTPSEIEVTAEEVRAAYKANKAAADAKFRNNILKITGAVERVVIDEFYDIYYINLIGGGKREEWNIRCMFGKKDRAELNRLTAGQTVTVQGKYDGYEINILIKDCALVR